MYQALLTRRYLTSKLMPLLSALAVTLCTAMVLTVWSVMGGFLNTLLDSGKTIIGDVAIDVAPPGGIPHYDEVLEALRADPNVLAAAPIIETPGMVAFGSDQRRLVQVMGVEPESFNDVTAFFDWQHWMPLDAPLKADTFSDDIRLEKTLRPVFDYAQSAGRTLTELNTATGATIPAAVPGIEVSQGNRRMPGNIYEPTWMFGIEEELTLSVLPLSQKGSAIAVESMRLPIANEFRTGLYETDANTIIVPLAVLQQMMSLTAGTRVTGSFTAVTNEDGTESFAPLEVERAIPAKITAIYLKAAPGVTPKELDAAAEAVYFAHHEKYPDDVLARGGTAPDAPWRDFFVYTWEEKPGLRSIISAVKKETGLVLILFSFISLTSVFLILAIFWSMISEKTRDIGVLRAVGASRAGVAWLFIRYGLVIGVVGAVSGVALAHAIVWNINGIHEWLGKNLGIIIWDPATYYFTEIPSKVDPQHALLVFVAGIASSGIGAVVPAVRGAWLDPVKALRFE